MRTLLFAIAFLPAIALAQATATQQTSWSTIRDTVTRINQSPHDTKAIESLETLAKEDGPLLATILIRTADESDLRPTVPDGYSHVGEAALLIMKRAIDPKNEYGLTDEMDWLNSSAYDHFPSFAVMLLGLCKDRDSHELLVDLATLDAMPTNEFLKDPKKQAFWKPAQFSAMRMLRGESLTPPETTRLDAALKGKPYEAWMHASFDYAAHLPTPEEQQRYFHFERQFWAASIPFEKSSTIIFDTPWRVPAIILSKVLKRDDEQYVLRIFESPLSTPQEDEVIKWLSPRLSDDFLAKLETLAKSNSPRASIARDAWAYATDQKARAKAAADAKAASTRPQTP